MFKAPTTADVMGGVIAALELAARSYGLGFGDFCTRIKRFGHGTTVSLNALLTGRAARTAIVTTLGFGDTLEIGRMRRQTCGPERHRGHRLFPAQPASPDRAARAHCRGARAHRRQRHHHRSARRGAGARGAARAEGRRDRGDRDLHAVVDRQSGARAASEGARRGRAAGCLRHAVARDLLSGRRVWPNVDGRRQRSARPDRRPLSGASRADLARGRHAGADPDDDQCGRRAADRRAQRPAGVCAVLRPGRGRHRLAGDRRHASAPATS